MSVATQRLRIHESLSTIFDAGWIGRADLYPELTDGFVVLSDDVWVRVEVGFK